jgi:hypothetical protein
VLALRNAQGTSLKSAHRLPILESTELVVVPRIAGEADSVFVVRPASGSVGLATAGTRSAEPLTEDQYNMNDSGRDALIRCLL